MSVMDEDAELLRAAAAGDDDAFAAFYRRHVDGIVAWLRARVREPEVAFDLTAETFAAAVAGAGAWRGEGSAVAWLYGIARNKWLESLRRGRVEDAARRRLGMEPVVLEDADLAAVEARAAAGLDVDALLEGLPEAQREAVVGRVIEERDYAELAASLACSEQVVRQRVSRGLAALRAEVVRDER
jgi:RNA polymerase sigma factor (sigma-70 family)